MKACLVIPIYDHGSTIGAVVESLAAFGMQCLLVDDGSSEPTRREIDRVQAIQPWVTVERHPRNLGRGVALRGAYRAAAARGMTHVVQLDADGQHFAADVPRFLEAARTRPDALVLGAPIFDDSVPWIRLHGRKLSRWIVRLETLSTSVDDPLCGFRCIPLAPTLAVIDGARMGDRMDFDPELVVRLVRTGVPVVNLPTPVRYPEGGISHFRMVEDNLRIAWAYARLAVAGSWRARAATTGVGA